MVQLLRSEQNLNRDTRWFLFVHCHLVRLKACISRRRSASSVHAIVGSSIGESGRKRRKNWYSTYFHMRMQAFEMSSSDMRALRVNPFQLGGAYRDAPERSGDATGIKDDCFRPVADPDSGSLTSTVPAWRYRCCFRASAKTPSPCRHPPAGIQPSCLARS